MSRNLGTQSPPLEFTSPIHPLGKADKSGSICEGVSDVFQRQGYFKDLEGSAHHYQTTEVGNDIAKAQAACLESIKLTQD
ncbi:hypothetical protein FRB99_002691, partial [Tulasnella sp. 403]